MADIIDSRNADQNRLMDAFRRVVREVNAGNREKLLSPMTITLGDEFQGIVQDVNAAIELIFMIEEKIIEERSGFKLRYVIYEGAIETPINENIAYGMMGTGLTNARQALEETKSSNYRYFFNLQNKKTSIALIKSMFVYQSIIDDWKIDKDYNLIAKFIKYKDYKKVADNLGKTRSQIWKREKSLKIEEYFSIKSVINYIAETK